MSLRTLTTRALLITLSSLATALALAPTGASPQELGPIVELAADGGTPAVATGSHGEIAVLWQAQIGDDEEYRVQRYSPALEPLGTLHRLGAVGGLGAVLPGLVVVRSDRTLATWLRLSRFSGSRAYAVAQAVGAGEEVGQRVGLGLWLTTDVATSGNGVVFAFSAPNRASGRSSVWVQRRSFRGSHRGALLRVTAGRSPSSVPVVAGDGAGRFTVLWVAESGDLLGRAWGPDDEELRSFRVWKGSAPRPVDRQVALAANRAGHLLAAWLAGDAVWARAYDPGGVPRGPARRVSETPLDGVLQLATAVDRFGRGVVVWDDADSTGEVRARIVGGRAQPLGDELVLAGPGAFGGSRLPDVASDGPGGFVAVWWILGDGVFARRIGWGGEVKTR